ncbi:MAG: AraC family transcriptional regulator [Rubrivivax sp.]|jgi:AraC-like DNA-binding protein|nr:AraC family transcriptional regulator [Rubrivivax sp.]
MPGRAEKSTEDAWSPLDFDQEAFRAGASERSFKRFARQGVRTLHAHEGGSGTSDTVRLDKDLLLTVINCVLPRTTRWRYDTDEALIMLRASLCCDVAFEVGSSAQLVFNRPEVTLVCLPKGRPQAVDIAGGARQQGVVAIFRASAFAARYGLELADLPPLVRDAVTGSAEVGRIASFPLDHRLAALLADTIDTRLEGEMRVLQYAGRLAELVAYTLDAMQHVPLLRGTALNRLRDVELAHAALARLEHSYRKPPLFAELAREIGTNQNKLKAVFKEAFGVTMAEYCLERRMREAQQLLLAANLTIAQVAERVGYEHQSSFAAAFSGHVGMSPREYRQHRAPFNLSLNASAEGDLARG